MSGEREACAGGRHLRFADVLALATCTRPWSPAVALGARIAARFGANLTGCYVPAPLRPLGGAEEPDPLMPAQRDEMQREDADDPADFPSFARGLGVPFAAWTVACAPIAPTLRQLGGWHDLVVLERAMVPPERTLDVLGEALLGCRVPCLILPPGWNGEAAFQRVAIGWNGSAEATGALRRALPILQLARHVTLIDGEMRRSDEDVPGVSRPDPVLYLRHHQVEVAMQHLHAPSKATGTLLLHKAHEMQADLLVMGAYSQSRTRERVFGGATRHVLLHADIPLLMQH